MKKIRNAIRWLKEQYQILAEKKIYDDCGDPGLFPDHVHYAPCVLADSSFRETEHQLGEYAGTSRV